MSYQGITCITWRLSYRDNIAKEYSLGEDNGGDIG